jgi:hypothetical protein
MYGIKSFGSTEELPKEILPDSENLPHKIILKSWQYQSSPKKTFSSLK